MIDGVFGYCGCSGNPGTSGYTEYSDKSSEYCNETFAPYVPIYTVTFRNGKVIKHGINIPWWKKLFMPKIHPTCNFECNTCKYLSCKCLGCQYATPVMSETSAGILKYKCIASKRHCKIQNIDWYKEQQFNRTNMKATIGKTFWLSKLKNLDVEFQGMYYEEWLQLIEREHQLSSNKKVCI